MALQYAVAFPVSKAGFCGGDRSHPRLSPNCQSGITAEQGRNVRGGNCNYSGAEAAARSQHENKNHRRLAMGAVKRRRSSLLGPELYS